MTNPITKWMWLLYILLNLLLDIVILKLYTCQKDYILYALLLEFWTVKWMESFSDGIFLFFHYIFLGFFVPNLFKIFISCEHSMYP